MATPKRSTRMTHHELVRDLRKQIDYAKEIAGDVIESPVIEAILAHTSECTGIWVGPADPADPDYDPDNPRGMRVIGRVHLCSSLSDEVIRAIYKALSDKMSDSGYGEMRAVLRRMLSPNGRERGL